MTFLKRSLFPSLGLLNQCGLYRSAFHFAMRSLNAISTFKDIEEAIVHSIYNDTHGKLIEYFSI